MHRLLLPTEGFRTHADSEGSGQRLPMLSAAGSPRTWVSWMSVALWSGVWKCLSRIGKDYLWREREQEREEEKGTDQINR